jgi:hypothetical protein
MKQDKITIKNSSEDENMKHLWFKGSYLGHAYREVDGYYVFVSVSKDGSWSSYSLRWVADALDELNKEWDKQVGKMVVDLSNAVDGLDNLGW